MESKEYSSLKVPIQMATQYSSFCKNEPQDPQESRSLFVTEESTEGKLTEGKSPPTEHCSEDLQDKLVADVKEVVLPLFKGETVCHTGQLKEPLEPSDYNHKDVCGWKSGWPVIVIRELIQRRSPVAIKTMGKHVPAQVATLVRKSTLRRK